MRGIKKEFKTIVLLIDFNLLKMDLSIEECQQLFLQYYGSFEEKEEESCKQNFVDNVCINCGEETEGTINYERPFYTNKPKHNTILSLIDLRN